MKRVEIDDDDKVYQKTFFSELPSAMFWITFWCLVMNTSLIKIIEAFK